MQTSKSKPEKKNIFLICGSETYLKRQKKDELLQRFDARADSGLNFNAFSGQDEIDYAEVARLLNTMPFMGQWRVVLLEDCGQLKRSPDADLLEAVKQLPDSTALIFLEQDVDAENALYKLVRERGEIFRFQKAADKTGKEVGIARTEIRRWATDYFRRAHRKIDTKRMDELLELTGYDMDNLKSEMDKLISYMLDEDPSVPIGSSEIETICSKTLSDRIFDMLDAKLRGNTDRALHLFEEMIAIKIKPTRVLYMIAQQFYRVYALKDLSESGIQTYSEPQLMQKLGMKWDWQLKRLRTQSARLGKQDARHYLDLCADLETRIKRGDLDGVLAVEMLLVM